MTASGIASRIIGFFYRIFLAQTIGAEALGIYQLIAPVFAMCFALTASSIQTSISKFVGDACGKNAGTSQGEITARGYLLLGLVISCTASVIVGIFLYTQADWIALHFLGELRCAPLLSLLSFSMLPCCIHACINGYYYGKKRAGIPSFCQLVEQLARVGSVWLIYQYTLEKGMELTAFHAVAGLVAGECSGLITSLIAMSLEKRLPGHSYHTLSGQWKTMGKLFSSMAVPLTINRVTTALFNSLENLLIPQKLQAFGYSASDALSIFGILTGMTMSIILFPSVLTNSFSVLLLPAVSEAHSAHNHAQIARAIKKAILYGLLLGFVFTILFLVFGDRMGEVLFHNTLAGNFICQLSWLCPLLYVTSLLNSILHGLGNARQVLFVTLLACMIRICMILFLVPQYGIDAYLWGMLLSYVFAAIADILLLMPYSRADDSSLFDLPQAEKTPVSTDHSAGTGVSLSRLFYYKVRLYTGQILTCSGINLDLVSLLYEQRNVYVCTCLNSSRLGSTCSGISLESRLCLCNLKLYEKRWLYCKYIALVRTDLNHLVLLNKLQCITDTVLCQVNLVISLYIHEMIEIIIGIQILHVLTINVSSRTLLCRTECLFYYTTTDDIF